VLQLKLEPKLSFNDPDIVPEYIMYPSPNGHGEVRGYLVRPAGVEGKLPAVVVATKIAG
jgi:carboxymethylenebutenolidase